MLNYQRVLPYLDHIGGWHKVYHGLPQKSWGDDFPYIGNFIIPTDELIFFRGVETVETTNQEWLKAKSSGTFPLQLAILGRAIVNSTRLRDGDDEGAIGTWFFYICFRFQDSSRMGRFSETGITKSILPLPHLIQWLTWMTFNDAEWSTDPSWFLWCCSNTICMCDRWKLRWAMITCSIVFNPRRRRRWCLALGPCISPLGYGLLIVLVDGLPSSQRFCWHNQRSIGTWMNMASIKLTHCFSMKGHEAGSHLSIACASEFQTVDGQFGNLRTHLWLSQMPNVQISKSKISK